MVHRILNGRAPSYLDNYFSKLEEVHNHNTRARVANLYLYKFKTMMGKVSFIYGGATEWNKLPLAIKEVQNPQAFKKKAKQRLLENISK